VKPSRAILLLAALLFICNIWGYDLWAPDEPFFGEGAREMVVDGQWLVTHVNGKVNTHKPPFFFWLIAILSLPFGRVLSLTARLPSALASLGTVAMTLRLGRRRTAVLAAFVLATSYMFWDKARSVQIDAVMCCLIWVALSAFAFWRAGDLDGRRAGLVFWAAGALAVLAKGPVGLLLPLGIALVTLAVDREIGRWRDFAPFSGPLLFALICGAWVAAATLWGPAEYSVWGALREHFVDRGLHGMHHAQPWWYYAKVLPPQLLPWAYLVPGALVLAWKRRNRDDRFLLVTVIFVVLFFSISTEKRTIYVLPAFPAFALMTARFVGAVLGWDEAPAISRRWLTAGQSLLAGFLILLGAAAPFAAQRVDEVPAWVIYAGGRSPRHRAHHSVGRREEEPLRRDRSPGRRFRRRLPPCCFDRAAHGRCVQVEPRFRGGHHGADSRVTSCRPRDPGLRSRQSAHPLRLLHQRHLHHRDQRLQRPGPPPRPGCAGLGGRQRQTPRRASVRDPREGGDRGHNSCESAGCGADRQPAHQVISYQ